MFREKSGKEWSSEENLLKFRKYLNQILDIQLALENYSDDTQDTSFYSDKSFELLSGLRKNRQIWEEEILISAANEILTDFNNILSKVGREHFTFYKDGSLEYKYQKGKQ